MWNFVSFPKMSDFLSLGPSLELKITFLWGKVESKISFSRSNLVRQGGSKSDKNSMKSRNHIQDTNIAKISLWKFPTKKANFCDFVQIFLISTPPCFTKTRFSHRVTALGSKSRAFLESWQNFTSDEVVFILGLPIFDRFLAQSFRKNRKNSKKIHFWRKFFFSRSILKCLLAGPKIKFGPF